MKTWDMLEILAKYPEKKFNNKMLGQVELFESILVWSSNMEDVVISNTLLKMEWEEVKEPVDFIEAVKSGKKIRSATWMQNTELDLPNLLYDMSDFDEEEIRQLLLDKWYIED